MLSTALTDRLGIDFPIIQAPIGSATCPALAASVANGGGLGMLAITWRDQDETRTILQETNQRTEQPFGVNIVLDEAAKTIPTEKHLEICAAEGVDIVSFSFGAAAPYVEQVHEFDGTVIQSVGSAAEARKAVDAGVDIIVAQGWEAGGHVQSEVATLPLIPRVVDVVDVPVVVAGGVANGRGIAAALTLGADGVWLGTRFLATQEARVHELYRNRVLEADETDTFFGTLFDEGWPEVPHRVLRNDTVDEWEEAGEPARGQRPNEDEIIAETAGGDPITRYQDALALPDMTGDIESIPLYAGQSTGLTKSIPSAETLVADLATDTRDALKQVTSLLNE